ncbi:T9SS type A sorting domain-containing protein [Candidatus Chrysopegis kryptomonas]|uniref:Por secretion system C-terminal sorting domain-containing protein n=1 Tax=Candidatus Chryseopegocella kryptomonas TaxID=1633643 RepID=A0A0P1MNH8_9BACT|nr:T9SS type A sorting domain-containing protein [Candidatus Chrysopegis kryptomonas]CUS96618.1 Por secretion system C-terminal sorting domain-containing protein [Candidatus Chrysopegis kryptomonas]
MKKAFVYPLLFILLVFNSFSQVKWVTRSGWLNDISDDGKVAVGSVESTYGTPTIFFIYPDSVTYQNFGWWLGAMTSVSSDGKVAVGGYYSYETRNAYVWFANSGFSLLPGSPSAQAFAITSDGSLGFGWSLFTYGCPRDPNSYRHHWPTVWDLKASPITRSDLPNPSPIDSNCGAVYEIWDVSDDGKTLLLLGSWGWQDIKVVHLKNDGSLDWWVSLNGPTGYPYARAVSISGDGTIVVGYVDSININFNEPVPVMWRASNNWQPEILARFPYMRARAYDVNTNAGIITGTAMTPGWVWEAVIWDISTATQRVKRVSDFYEVDGRLESAGRISRNGRFVIVKGVDKNNQGGWGVLDLTLRKDYKNSVNGRLLWLGKLPYSYRITPTAVSSDGSVVTGYTGDGASGTNKSFRWTQQTGLVPLRGHRYLDDWANSMTPDGKLIVGRAAFYEGSSVVDRTFVWRDTTGALENLLPNITSIANDISSDGSTIVGYAYPSGSKHAYRWNVVDGFQDLGTLGGRESEAWAVSSDGSVVVGWSQDSSGYTKAFRWVKGIGMQNLGIQSRESYATDVSPDGKTVIGYFRAPDGGFNLFRWNVSSGFTDLGRKDWGISTVFVEAPKMSSDGSRIVGTYAVSGGSRPFLWTADSGFIDLNQMFSDILNDGSVLVNATAISPNGKFIVGRGYNAFNGQENVYLLELNFTTSVLEKSQVVPVSFNLYQNYPNPFNPSTTIEFDIPERTFVKLVVYDILGREIATIVDKELDPGRYKVNFNAENLSNGIYFYTLKTAKFTKTNKMVLLK